jgi:hypothetical protein
VRTGSGNLERTLHGFLAFHLGKIQVFIVLGRCKHLIHIDPGGRNPDLPFKKLDCFAKILDRDDIQSGDGGRLGRIIRRHQDANFALVFGAQSNRQNPLARSNRTREGEFTDDYEIIELISFELFGGGEHADGDGQVEAGALLFYVRGGEVDGGASHREFKTRIAECGGDAIF